MARFVPQSEVGPPAAGIVADSDAKAEWQETIDKARVLTDLADEAMTSAHAHPPPRTPPEAK